jgi:hypothetical protein
LIYIDIRKKEIQLVSKLFKPLRGREQDFIRQPRYHQSLMDFWTSLLILERSKLGTITGLFWLRNLLDSADDIPGLGIWEDDTPLSHLGSPLLM